MQRQQVYGGKTSIQGAATSGTASTIAFTPLQVILTNIQYITCVLNYTVGFGNC